jgi:3-deoxy-7-phosphoheptulonate synthase
MSQLQSDRNGIPSAYLSEKGAANHEQPLPSPRALQQRFPLTARGAQAVRQTRQQIADLLHGRDSSRLLMVVGPCSIHDPYVALDYAWRLRGLMERVRDSLVLVMRTYVEKPRTTTGWTGYVYDPELDGAGDLSKGLADSRNLITRITDIGVPCAAEMLDPRVSTYLADLYSWVAIGARTSESQVHRQLASSLPIPVGFKNSTDGNVQIAVNSVIAARQGHRTLVISASGRLAALITTGNQDCHVVLRGSETATNCDATSIARAERLLKGLTGPRCVVVDAAHGNSRKDHTRQRDAFNEALAYYAAGNTCLLGLSLESNLFPGKQTLTPGSSLRYGVSITDPCIGWEETEELVLKAARAVAANNRRQPAVPDEFWPA